MPMPRVQDILDLFARYYQILMDPEWKKYTAFPTRDSLYMYNKMQMGLKIRSVPYKKPWTTFPGGKDHISPPAPHPPAPELA